MVDEAVQYKKHQIGEPVWDWQLLDPIRKPVDEARRERQHFVLLDRTNGCRFHWSFLLTFAESRLNWLYYERSMNPIAKSPLRHPAFDRLGVAFGELIERCVIQSKLCVEVF